MANLLLVDDDEDFSETLRDLFEMQEHSVMVAATGGDGLSLLSANSFDLILLDWQLPDMPGIDVCKQYREQGGKSRILMLTGMRDAASREAGKAAGADDMLIKPFTLDQLLGRVQKMLSEAVEPTA